MVPTLISGAVTMDKLPSAGISADAECSVVLHGLLRVTSETLQCCTTCWHVLGSSAEPPAKMSLDPE